MVDLFSSSSKDSDRTFIASSDILCLIPMKDVHDAKKRLRTSFSPDKQPLISDIITKLFVNTISTAKKVFDFAVVSPSEDTLELALDQGASFIYQDLGIDLNDALTTSINYAHHTAKWKYVLILTADLPYFADDTLTELQTMLLNGSFTIISAPQKTAEQGTSGLLIPLKDWPSFKLQFGVNSFNLFKKQLVEKQFPFIEVHNKIGFDLDTIDDLNDLKIQSTTIFKQLIAEDTISQLFT